MRVGGCSVSKEVFSQAFIQPLRFVTIIGCFPSHESKKIVVRPNKSICDDTDK